MAQQYVLADNAFQTQGSESFTAHQALIAGGTAIDGYQSMIDDPTGFPWGCDANTKRDGTRDHDIGQQEQGPFPCLTYPNGTIRDLLDAKSVSWKYYANKVYQVESTQRPAIPASGAPSMRSNRSIQRRMGNERYEQRPEDFRGHQKRRLPAVSWVTPDGANSDHPDEKNKNGPIDTGPSWVASIVNAVGRASIGRSTRHRRALGRLGRLLRSRRAAASV